MSKKKRRTQRKLNRKYGRPETRKRKAKEWIAEQRLDLDIDNWGENDWEMFLPVIERYI